MAKDLLGWQSSELWERLMRGKVPRAGTGCLVLESTKCVPSVGADRLKMKGRIS